MKQQAISAPREASDRLQHPRTGETDNKSDRLDADRLWELLRLGSLKAVHHGAGFLLTLKGTGQELHELGRKRDACDAADQGAVLRCVVRPIRPSVRLSRKK